MKVNWLLALGIVVGTAADADSATSALVLESDYVHYEIGADARNLRLFDTQTGTEYLKDPGVSVAAYVHKDGTDFPATRLERDSAGYVLEFESAGARAVLRPVRHPHFLTIEVVSVEGERVDALTFLNADLALEGSLGEPFAACALALNLKTRVNEIPGPNNRLRATCYRRFGFEGARVGLIGCPQSELRTIMKEVVRSSPELPQYTRPIGGPWALDADINCGSYLFDFGKITEETVDEWIRLANSLGINQIDFHTGTSLRFGDYTPDPTLFPQGRDSLKRVVERLHEAGIAAGLHTYAFFIAKDSPYVTPVPDPGLGKDAVFTLAAPLTAEADTVPVLESTAQMSTVTGFFVQNSVTLQIGDELITYAGVNKEPPYAFTGCGRGMHGTEAVPHDAGATVSHLKECFGLFTPDPDSPLFTQIAQNTADTFNECGFDMIYLDALDGESILAGPEFAWHYGSRFVFDIAERLKKPALFEMSTFHHHLWYVRARMGAWDASLRSHKRYIDVHLAANDAGKGMFLPMNLGWWAVQTWAEGPKTTYVEPTYPDDAEYLMCKCLASDSGFAVMGVDPERVASVPAFARLAPIFQRYENLRHRGYFPESVKHRLRAPGEEFTLEQGPDEEWRFRPIRYIKHKVQGMDGWSNRWTIDNPFDAQPVRIRVEALMSCAPYDSSEAIPYDDFRDASRFTDRAAEDGVSAQIETSPDGIVFSALSNRPERDGAWAKVERPFDPPLALGERCALGVWVEGDGQGELLNIQLRSPRHTVYGGIGDHYVEVDFTGWRYFELIELEGGRIADHVWPYGGSAYGIYREGIDFDQIASLSLWYNRLPSGKTAVCALRPIHALPLVQSKLIQPRLSINGVSVEFPVELESGSYLESGPSGWTVYGRKGETLAEAPLTGTPIEVNTGANAIEFACKDDGGPAKRAYVTVIVQGAPLTE